MSNINSTAILIVACMLGLGIVAVSIWAPTDRAVLAMGTLSTLVVAVLAVLKIDQVHSTFNSKMDRMLQLTATSAHAEGVKEGEASVRPESA